MAKEMPEWLKEYYNRLWERYKNESFTFDAAMKELGISKKMITKTLLEIEKKGFLSKETSPIDYRARIYRLISPEDIKFAAGIYSLMEKEKIKKLSLIDKLVFVGDKLPYAITGSHAAYRYHNYVNPSQTLEMKIHLEDAGKWIAFLTDEKTRVFLGDVTGNKRISNYVKLLHSNRAIDYIRTKARKGYYIEKPEFLIIEFLERQSQTGIIEAAAIILTNRKSLSWSGRAGLPELAKDCGVSRRLGFLLDAINLEAGRKIISPKIIEQIKKDVEGKIDDVFPGDEISLDKFKEMRNKIAHGILLTENERLEIGRLEKQLEGYNILSKKWGMRIILPRQVIRKVLDDLV